VTRRGRHVGWAACAIAGAVVAGCATQRSWEARVSIDQPIPAVCIVATLDGERDVFDVIETGRGDVALRLELEGVAREDAPALAVTQARGMHGRPTVEVSTHYQVGMFHSEKDNERLLSRARELTLHLAEVCTGRKVELGITKECGRGEPNALCVKGE
jgi:hypothetical protein